MYHPGSLRALAPEAVREAVAKTQVSANGRVVPLTVSIGVAQWVAHESRDEILRRADAALYRPKETGRNRVVHADVA